MMGYFADCYVIVKTRSREQVTTFLDRFLPGHEQLQDEYQIPYLADQPEIEFDNASDLMEYLEKHPSIYQSLYWNNKDKRGLNKCAMTFYTIDGYIIFGISRDTAFDYSNTSNEDECLEELMAFFKTDKGYITYETHPPDNYADFMKIVSNTKNLS